MSINEFLILSALIGIGLISGAFFGCTSARRGNEFVQGMFPALGVAILVPLIIMFLFACYEVSPRSEGLAQSLGAALGITLFYGIGSSLIAGLSALISCWLAFKSQSPT